MKERKTLVRVPNCFSEPEHGQMLRRETRRQTYEQKWCGIWYDCQTCHSTLLLPSEELTEQSNRLLAQKNEPLRIHNELALFAGRD